MSIIMSMHRHDDRDTHISLESPIPTPPPPSVPASGLFPRGVQVTLPNVQHIIYRDFIIKNKTWYWSVYDSKQTCHDFAIV